MDKKAIAETLRALASNDKHRSKAARFRDVFNDVEQTLAAGVSRTQVLATLTDLGLDYTLKGFDSALRRNRLKFGKATSRRTPPRAPADESTHSTHTATSHNPADLNKIIASKPDLDALAKLAKRKPR